MILTKTAKQPVRTWIVDQSPNEASILGMQVNANTKGEARAALKEHLKVKVLPAGIVLSQVKPA